VDLNPSSISEPRPLRILDLDELKESVHREVSRLLNTRAHRSFEADAGTVIDYGLPDFSALSARSAPDRQLLANSLERLLARFEPRLRNVRVAIEPHPARPTSVTGVIEGWIHAGTMQEPVSFPIFLYTSGGAVQSDVTE
jgi:type VI secretion system lysozyme-like protein